MEKINFVNNQAPAINGTNLNQLQTNVENAINGVVASGSSNGISWIKLSDGTLIQRGSVNCNNEGAGYINYPISFIDNNYTMTADNKYNSSGELGIILTTNSGSTSSGAVYFRKYVNGTLTIVKDTTIQANWIAIGRWK